MNAKSGTTKIQINQNNNIEIQHHSKSTNPKTALSKTQSNVEKITAMLVSQNLMGSNNNTTNNDNNNHHQNRITINIPNEKMKLKKSESSPINGILKNNNATTYINNGTSTQEQRNIRFGNM